MAVYKRHYLKTWPKFFDAVLSGVKTFEFRKNDREFMLGDHLLLKEWDPQTEAYTGRELEVHVNYILRCCDHGKPIPDWPMGWCVMGINPVYNGYKDTSNLERVCKGQEVEG